MLPTNIRPHGTADCRSPYRKRGDQAGEPGKRGVRPCIFLGNGGGTRKELATFLGMTHENLYRSTRELVKEGLVRFAGQTMEILDQDLLAEITE